MPEAEKRTSRRRTLPLSLVAITATLLVLAGSHPAIAQETDLFALSLLGGVGSATDAAHSGFQNPSLQIGYTVEIDPEVQIGVRVGGIGFGSEDVVNGHSGPTLTYATVAGGYQFREAIYDSGIYLGLGVYRMEGAARAGVVLGYTGDFEVSRRWSVLLELNGHYADFRHDQAFAQVLAGVQWHF
jgi:hypothetical protein